MRSSGGEEAFRSATRRNSAKNAFRPLSRRILPSARRPRGCLHGRDVRMGAPRRRLHRPLRRVYHGRGRSQSPRAHETRAHPRRDPERNGARSVATSETERTRAIAPATGDDARHASSAVSDDPDAASDDRDASREPAKTPRADQTTPWAEHKRAGAESFQRGAFRDAADRFRARREGDGRRTRERNTTETRVDAVTLAGLHRFRLRGAPARRRLRRRGGGSGAVRCRAPGVGQGAFPRRRGAQRRRTRFDAAREASRQARECAENDAASGAHDGSVPNGDVAILERRIAACARAARGAAMCDEEESSLAAAAEARRLEAERKMEASSDENVARLNAEAEDRERDPNARRLIREIEALFAEARKTTEETRDAEETEETPAASGGKEKQETRKRTPRFPARAARLLAELLSVEPENFEAAFQAAVLSLRENRTLDAIAYARRCLARAPGFARARRLPGDVPRDHAGGGDRSRGDDAHRARVRVGTESVSTESPAPSESEAELALAMAVMSNPESPDTWTAFARHLARRGLASDAVAALRDALAGGPEGKWLKPRSDAALLTTLGFMLHLRGHVAEPASLYASAAAHGGGMVTATLAARVAGGDDDDAVSRARGDARGVLGARAGDGAAPGGFERGVRRAAVRGGGEEARRGGPALGRGGRGCRAPDALLGPRDWGPGRAALGGTRARLETSLRRRDGFFAGGRAAWLLKARRRAFEAPCVSRRRARVRACSRAAPRLRRSSASPTPASARRRPPRSGTSRRPRRRIARAGRGRDAAPLRDAGRARRRARGEPRGDAERGGSRNRLRDGTRKRLLLASLRGGFVIRAAPRWLDARDDDDADGDRDDADGDCTQTDDEEDFVVDVASAAEAETWANGETVGFGFVDAGAASDDARRPMDWARAYASARRKAETYFRLADGTAWRERHGEMDARAAWRRARCRNSSRPRSRSTGTASRGWWTSNHSRRW